MAKKKKEELNTRGMSAAERREAFLTARKTLDADWRVQKEDTEIELVPFNILPLDYGLRLYGMGRGGAVYQLHGDEGCGKSTSTYSILASYQQTTNEPVAIFDYERTSTMPYLRAVGLNTKPNMLFVKRPDSVKDGIKDAIHLLENGVRILAFDSIPRMRSMVEVEDVRTGAAFSNALGAHARAIQEFYDIMLPYIAKHDATLFMINQTRSRIEMTQEAASAAKGYATVTNLNYTLPGGRANRYAISVMVELKLVKAWRPGKHDDPFVLEPEARRGEEYLANEIRLRSLKNKVSGTGFRESTMWIRPGSGVDNNISIRQMARGLKLIHNHGPKYVVGESIDNAIKVYDGKNDAIQDLVIDENPEILEALNALVIEKIKTNNSFGSLVVDEQESKYLAGEGYDDFESDVQTQASVQNAISSLGVDEI